MWHTCFGLQGFGRIKVRDHSEREEGNVAYIDLDHVSKEFFRYKRPDGIKKRVMSLVHRDYERKKAVDDLFLSVEKGELVGYIGTNGAGKSTTIKMLAGILTPSQGKISVAGMVPYENRKRNAMQIGVVFGQRTQLNWDLPVKDSFELYRSMYRVKRERYLDNVEMFMELLDLRNLMEVPVRQLSLGQKMRVELAVALLHDPGILYLDEPTIGLDVIAKDRIRHFVRELNREKGTTVILTTHDMRDVEEICSRIVMIDQGRIMLDLPKEKLREYGSGTLEDIVRRIFLEKGKGGRQEQNG